MKKIVFIFLLSLSFVSILCADEITNLLDSAKVYYNNNDTKALLKTIETIKEKLKNEEKGNSLSDVVEVSFNRLKVTPEKYENKALKLRGVAIGSSAFKKIDYYNKKSEYGVLLENIEQNDFFYSFLDEGKIIFVMEEKLVDKLIDIIPSGYSNYYNIWTEPVYKYSYYLSQYSPERICYIAKIVKLEAISYNKYSGKIVDTGKFIEE